MSINTVVRTKARFIIKRSPNVHFFSPSMCGHMCLVLASLVAQHTSPLQAFPVHSHHSILWLPVMVAFRILSLGSSMDKRKNHGLNTYAGKTLNIGRLLCNGKKFSISFLSRKLLQAQQTIH